MVVLDATFLLLLLNPNARVPGDASGVPIVKSKERIDLLIRELNANKTHILVPTPALAEILIEAGNGFQDFLDKINKQSVFEVVPFDEAAAIEVSIMARTGPGKKKADKNTTYAKLKYDRQIVAIARVRGATAIYSDDLDIKSICNGGPIKVVGLADLPLPPENPQPDLFADAKATTQISA